MAKFKVGDKVRVQAGTYPENYTAIKITPNLDLDLNQDFIVFGVANDNRSDVMPDYLLKTVEGYYAGYIDEVHLVPVEDSQEKEPAPVLLEQAIGLLESINAKLDALDARLTAHEAKANAVITLNVNGAVQVAEEPVAQHLSNACQEVDLPDEQDGWLYNFDEWMQVPIGSLVEVAFEAGSDKKFILEDNHVNYANQEGFSFKEGDESSMPLRLKALPDGPRRWSASTGMIALRVIR